MDPFYGQNRLQATDSKNLQGLWIYIEKEPVKTQQNVALTWGDLKKYLSAANIDFIRRNAEKSIDMNQRLNSDADYLLIMIGYTIPNKSQQETHWELIQVARFDLPLFLDDSQIDELSIKWGYSYNCSYSRYFGRGKLNEKLTDVPILIIGVGAIGSSVAKYLTRGGARYLALMDFDILEPGNICRSEYNLTQVGDNKAHALRQELLYISPFLASDVHLCFPFVTEDMPQFNEIKNSLSNYKIIIDCSTDMEVSHVLDNMRLDSTIINISITNKAKELVCVVGKPEVSQMKASIFDQFQKIEEELFFEGAGCQYPTFEASYTAIQALLTYAMKQIDYKLSKDALNTFVLRTANDPRTFKIEIDEY